MSNSVNVDKLLREIADDLIAMANFANVSIRLGHTDSSDCTYFESMADRVKRTNEKLRKIFARDREYLDKIAVPLFGEGSKDKLFP